VSKSDPAAAKKERNKTIRWVVTIFFVTIVISGTISFVSDEVMAKSGIFTAFLILLTIILIGIVFDVIGMAVASADEKPFHSMAARKVPGSQQAIRLLRNAERVSSICNDVVGDICGVISGSASAVIAANAFQVGSSDLETVLQLLMSALVAGITVGGKAFGKSIAMGNSTAIVHTASKIIYSFRSIPSWIGKLFRKR